MRWVVLCAGLLVACGGGGSDEAWERPAEILPVEQCAALCDDGEARCGPPYEGAADCSGLRMVATSPAVEGNCSCRRVTESGVTTHQWECGDTVVAVQEVPEGETLTGELSEVRCGR